MKFVRPATPEKHLVMIYHFLVRSAQAGWLFDDHSHCQTYARRLYNAVNLRVVNYAHADVFDAIRLDLHGRRRISCSVVPDSRSRSQRTSAVKMTPLQTPQQPHWSLLLSVNLASCCFLPVSCRFWSDFIDRHHSFLHGGPKLLNQFAWLLLNKNQ